MDNIKYEKNPEKYEKSIKFSTKKNSNICILGALGSLGCATNGVFSKKLSEEFSLYPLAMSEYLTLAKLWSFDIFKVGQFHRLY